MGLSVDVFFLSIAFKGEKNQKEAKRVHEKSSLCLLFIVTCGWFMLIHYDLQCAHSHVHIPLPQTSTSERYPEPHTDH